ncbi:hypothetical protein EPA93_11355 [Ktedonosporobacter rubrisoli]|uniref:Beta/gamma crystallin 'Greek key' domain-containing protein n=1 Tax=Ktedonosporobacter rubrisoli TaxID=2509675 RepID=A0A4P6JMT3_KTERU|nr:beta/gamma crystallin-related protein [Ktedonosporobacter rubrisoli]QBD76565.1 hypothetical protein EPA93_11355 [Ktedonosporobacter rubrisoli]
MASQITLFAERDFRGACVVITEAIANLGLLGFNDKASSAKVEGEWWTVYLHTHYEGLRADLGPGDWPDLGIKDLNDAISSVRPTSAEDAARAASLEATPLPRWFRPIGIADIQLPSS